MTNLPALRKQYAPRALPGGRWRRPAGGKDVLALCDTIDRLNAVIDYALTHSYFDDSNEVQKRRLRVMK